MIEHTALPKEKQTSLGLYVTAAEAYQKWKADPEKVKILDVRTLEEFIHVGHPTMAWNVPIAIQTNEWDAAKCHFSMKPTPDFIARVKDVASPTDTLLATCRSGGRGAMAVNLLAKAGFDKVYNIVDGVEGDMVDEADNVFRGLRMKNGWKNSGLPWSYEIDPTKIRLPGTSA
jgi:rhodanese-related sulfurtransferase